MLHLFLYIFSITAKKESPPPILHFRDNGMMLPVSQMVPQHFARCSEHQEEEKKETVLNFVVFISVTCNAACRIQTSSECHSGPN